MEIIKQPETTITGHRQRLRERFISKEKGSCSDESLLELILTYAIPQKDVRPLAQQLIKTYGDIDAVMNTPFDELCKVDGIKANSAVLLKLVDHIRRSSKTKPASKGYLKESQQSLFDQMQPDMKQKIDQRKSGNKPKVIQRYGTALFGKSLLEEAVEILPRLPDSDSLDVIRDFLRNNLHFSAEQTRQRYSNYIIKRMFNDGCADAPLRAFAKAFPNSPELREVCFYRFMRAEPLEMDIVENLLLPNIGAGCVLRERIRDILRERYPTSRSIMDCGQAIVEALKAGGIALTEGKNINFAYREIPCASFAFILHSEYPEPGMYNLDKLEANPLIRAMLWNPERYSYAIYELRNRGLISKVSEIDGIRQFTTKYTLAEAVERIAAQRV